MRRAPWLLWVGMWLGQAGCGVRVAPPYLIDGLHVVAIVAEPPETHPGVEAVLQAYIAVPPTMPGAMLPLWSYCQERSADRSQQECADPVPVPAAAPVILMPGVVRSDCQRTVLASDLAQVPALMLQAGFWELMRLDVSAPTAPTFHAIKRLVVSDAMQTVNRNPILRHVSIWARGSILSEPVQLHGGETLELVADYDESGFQPYRVLGADGQWQPRMESPTFTWYVTDGTLDAYVTTGNRSVRWKVPEAAQLQRPEQQFFTVLRDGRGGTAVYVGSVTVGDGSIDIGPTGTTDD